MIVRKMRTHLKSNQKSIHNVSPLVGVVPHQLLIMEGVNKLMQNKLTPEQESFVKVANEQGFTTEITRKDILSLESNNGAKWPRWLVRDSLIE